MDHLPSVYLNEVQAGVFQHQSLPFLPYLEPLPDRCFEGLGIELEGEMWIRSRTTTVEVAIVGARGAFDVRPESGPVSVIESSVEVPQGASLWKRFKSWFGRSKEVSNPTAGGGAQSGIHAQTGNTGTGSPTGEGMSQPGAAGTSEPDCIAETTVTDEMRVTRWYRNGAAEQEKRLVKATQELARREDIEAGIFNDVGGSSLEDQTYKRFIENEYRLGRKRGTRGKQRPYRTRKVEYCSLMEHAYRLMSEPGFTFTRPELADVYRELVAIHKREGCELGFAGKNGLVYEIAPPGKHEALVASTCREITRVGSGFVQGHFKTSRREVAEDLSPAWRVHWAATGNRTGLTICQWLVLHWWLFKNRIGFSAPTPPQP